MPDLVRTEIESGLATLTLDQPPVNPLNAALIDALRAALEGVSKNGDIRCLVITGGSDVFAAGGDVKEMKDWDYGQARRLAPALGAVCRSLADLPYPVIAAINGFCLGGGLEVALAADLRIAADNSKLGFPEILLGLIPGAGGTQRLPRLIGLGRAKSLMFTGRTIRAAEALEIGLVDEVLPADQVAGRAQEIGRGFANGPSLALAALKQSVSRGIEVDLTTGLAIEEGLFAGLFATEDRRIGIDSFLAQGPGKATFVGN